MSATRKCSLQLVILIAIPLFLTSLTCFAADQERPDSFKYYGPGGMDKLWDRPDWQPHRLGRDTWIHWTWGNQKFLRFGAKSLGDQLAPVSLDLYRLLDSRQRDSRFSRLGLINEPNCLPAKAPNEYGLWLDEWAGDPEHYYPTDPAYAEKQNYPGTQDKVDTTNYGEPSGVVGIRLFKNPKFKKENWNVKAYFENPGKVEPPHLIGFTCALCHMDDRNLMAPADGG